MFFYRNLEKDSPGVLYASVNPEYMNSSEGNASWFVEYLGFLVCIKI